MTQKISTTTISNLKNSSMFQRFEDPTQSQKINRMFSQKENSPTLQPKSSELYSDKTETLFENPKSERGDSFDNQIEKKNFFKNLMIKNSLSEDILSENSSSSSNPRPSMRKWKRISLFFRSIRGFQENEAMRLDNIDSLDKIMEKYEPNAKTEKGAGKKKKKRRNKKTEFEIALDQLLDIEKLIDCSERGGKEDIEIIKSIVEKDPKRYLISSKDPEHLINKKNRYGHTALYNACKNGNLAVVSYLIENEANLHLKIKLEEGIDETPLEVATRWGHKDIIELLLESSDFSEKELKPCFSLAMAVEIKSLLNRKINLIQNQRSDMRKTGGFFDEILSYFCC